MTNLDLLRIEIDTLWRRDEQGRLHGPRQARTGRRPVPHLLVGATADGWLLEFDPDLPGAVAREIESIFDGAPPQRDLSEPPAVLDACERLVTDAMGPVTRRGDLSYHIPPGTSFATGADIVDSSRLVDGVLWQQDLARLTWPDDEWRQLLDGELGPWAFVMDGERVVSICHSARLTERGAEAGTWTDPDYRGRGYAAAATAAWASLLVPSGRQLFYGTWAENVSSQRVAQRLGLPLIAWIWTLTAAAD